MLTSSSWPINGGIRNTTGMELKMRDNRFTNDRSRNIRRMNGFPTIHSKYKQFSLNRSHLCRLRSSALKRRSECTFSLRLISDVCDRSVYRRTSLPLGLDTLALSLKDTCWLRIAGFFGSTAVNSTASPVAMEYERYPARS